MSLLLKRDETSKARKRIKNFDIVIVIQSVKGFNYENLRQRR